MSLKRGSSNVKNLRVFSPKYNLIFKKLFIENGENGENGENDNNSRSKYLIELLNTIYNYDKKSKNGLRIRSIEFIKNMGRGYATAFSNVSASFSNSLPSPTFINKRCEKHFKANNIFNRFSDSKLNENKPFLLDCVCYVSEEDTNTPSFESISLGNSFILHIELRDRTEYNNPNIINFIDNQIKFQQIFYFQQNMFNLISPQSPTTPSSSKLSCFKKTPNIRSIYFIKNEEKNDYPCLYHVNPVIFDNSLEKGCLNTDNSSTHYYQPSCTNDLTTVIQLSKINDENSNITNQNLKDWLNFINIGNNKSILITEKTSINVEFFKDETVVELINYLGDISNNNSINNELLSTKEIIHNMKVIEEKAKIESIIRMFLVLTDGGLMSFDDAKDKVSKMYPNFVDFIDDLTEKELMRQKRLLDSNGASGNPENGDSLSDSDYDSEDEWEMIKDKENNKAKGEGESKEEDGGQLKRSGSSSSLRLIIDNVKSTFSSLKPGNKDKNKSKQVNETRKEESNEVESAKSKKSPVEQNNTKEPSPVTKKSPTKSINSAEPSPLKKKPVDKGSISRGDNYISRNLNKYNSDLEFKSIDNTNEMFQPDSELNGNDFIISENSLNNEELAFLSDLSSETNDDISDESNPNSRKNSAKSESKGKDSDNVIENSMGKEVDISDSEREINESIDLEGNHSRHIIKREIDEDGNIVEYEEQIIEIEVDEDGNEIDENGNIVKNNEEK